MTQAEFEETWAKMDTDERLAAVLMLIMKLSQVCEMQGQCIGEIQDRLQTLELSSEV
jgi:hypothetical protein